MSDIFDPSPFGDIPVTTADDLREARITIYDMRLALDAIQKAAEHWAALHPGNTTAALIASLAKEVGERCQ